MRRLDRDQFTSLPVKAAANATMQVIDGIQLLSPHEQLVGLAAAFLLVCEAQKVSAQDAFTVTKNIMNHAQGRRVEFDAVRVYAENEL